MRTIRSRFGIWKFNADTESAWASLRGDRRPSVSTVLQLDAIESLLPLGGQRVLDFGAGRGFIAGIMKQRGCIVYGLDVSISLCESYSRNLSAIQGGAAKSVICADGSVAPVRSESLDAVVCNSVVEHVDSPARLLVEIARVLKSDGTALLTTPNRSHQFPSGWPVFWLGLLRLNSLLGGRLLAPFAHGVTTIEGAEEAWRRRFDHRYLFTLDDLIKLLPEGLTAIESGTYMVGLAGRLHDLAYSVRLVQGDRLVRSILVLSRLFRNVGEDGDRGKGIYVVLRKC